MLGRLVARKEYRLPKKTLIIIFIVICFIALVRSFFFKNIGVNITESVNFRFYKIYPIDAKTKLHIGDYVLFKYQKEDERFVKKGQKVVKRVACLSGSVISYDNTSVFCDGKKIKENHAIVSEKYGKVYPLYSAGLIPNGKLFLIGDHERSFDSRFWGLVDEKDIIAIVRPLFK